MVSKKESNKRALKFTLGYLMVVLSLLGWLEISLVHPNKYIWLLSIPVMALISIVGVLMVIAYVYQK